MVSREKKVDPVVAHNNWRRGTVDRDRRITQGLSYYETLNQLCTFREAQGWGIQVLMTEGWRGGEERG